jgi:hypothetical protein
MPTLSQALQADLVSAVEAQFGEKVYYRRTADSTYVLTDDIASGAVPPTSMIAVVRLEGTTATRESQRGSEVSAKFSSDQASATLAESQFGVDLGRPRVGDTITLSDRDGSPVFRIAAVMADGKGRFSCTLARTTG